MTSHHIFSSFNLMAFQNGPLFGVLFLNTKNYIPNPFLFWRSSDKLIINLKMQFTCSVNYAMIRITLAMKSFATYRN